MLPWVNNLRVFPAANSLDRVPVWYWILNADLGDWSIKQRIEKMARSIQVAPPIWIFSKPAHPTVAKKSTRRVGYHQIPAIVQHIQNAALIMSTRRFSREQVARHSLVTQGVESVSNYSTVFASN
tara:strand:- start:490 stop:864 length:375 start_codon:yes stop_codon:yes gene_type:complete